jgi:hypothetical protein
MTMQLMITCMCLCVQFYVKTAGDFKVPNKIHKDYYSGPQAVQSSEDS